MSDLQVLAKEMPADPREQTEFVAIRCDSIVRRINEITDVIEAQQTVAMCSTVEHALREIGAVEDAVFAARATLFWAERHVVIAARNAIPFEDWLADRRKREPEPHDDLPLPSRKLDALDEDNSEAYVRFLRPNDVPGDRWRMWNIFADAPIERWTAAIETCLTNRNLSRRSLVRVLEGASTPHRTVPTKRQQWGKPVQTRWREFVRLVVWSKREAEWLTPHLGEVEMTETDQQHLLDALDQLSELVEKMAVIA